MFVKVLEFSDLSSGIAKDIIKLYYENKMIGADFEFAHEIDEKDFEKFKSLPDFLSFKYNVPSTRKLRKLPLSIMEEFFKDEFLRFDENNYILNFISKNKESFLAERIKGTLFKSPKGIVETYFDASGIYDKFYNSKMQEYEILEKKARKLNQFPAYTRGRKGTDKYVKEILRDTFNLGKNFIVEKFKENWNEGKIEFITEQRRLYLEGLKQSNCVYSYVSIIENNGCIILSYKEIERTFTIEVKIDGNKFYVEQCLERFNKRTEKVKEIEDKINSLGKLYSFILSKESNI